MPSPAAEYTQRLSIRAQDAQTLEKLHARIGNARLALAALTIVAAWGSLLRHAFPPWWLLAPVAVFIGLVRYHYRVRRARSRAERATEFYRRGLARVQDRWGGTGQTGARFSDPHHVYAADLDLFGKGSLFELLCTARTRMGEDCLARWLLAPAPLESIRERQTGVAELRNRLDLREELAVLGENLNVAVYPEALLQWAEAPNTLEQRWIRPISLLLPLLAAACAILWGVAGIASPFFLVVLTEAVILYRLKERIDQVVHGTENAFDDLGLLGALLSRVEQERFDAPSLHALVGQLSTPAPRASRAMGRLSAIASFAGSRRNQVVAVLSVPLMYGVHVALAAERWRRVHGCAVRRWVHVMGEFEALLCVAAYSHEHPGDPFAEFVDGPGSFQGTDLAHPLIPAAQCVGNNVSIAGTTRVMLISGSNMSGKSTLLRTVGINSVLAMAGAPVRARQLQLTPVQTGASIRINDSLHEGSSRFYAEITRIRQLFDLTDSSRPLLFLLDELLQGTNSNDRRVGAEGIVRALVERGAIGLISTHDLALTDIRGLEDGSLHNVHFQDELDNGRMTFDFKLQEGVVTKSNAVELMRAIGLKV